MPWKLRLKFAERIKEIDFSCKIIVYKNPIKQGSILEDFLYQIIKPDKFIYKIIIDGTNGVKYERRLKIFLREKGIKIYKIRFIDNRKEASVRLANFIAGAYRSFLDNKDDKNTYIYQLRKHRIKILN